MKSTRFYLARAVAYFVSLLFIGSTFGQPLNIAVSSAQYSTFVYGDAPEYSSPFTFTPVSRTTVSSSPVSDELTTNSPLFAPNSTNFAKARSDLFKVSTTTEWNSYTGGTAIASATNQLWFSPVVDQVQAVGIQISAQVIYEHTGGSISLLDLTSNSELWNYHWTGTGGNVPFGDPFYTGELDANFNVGTDFVASHQYLLTMTVGCNAAGDHEIADIQVTGLQVVPEPSSVCLLLVAFGTFFRRQICRATLSDKRD